MSGSGHHSEFISDRILVSGSGPAGMIAALAMAQAGYDVLLAGPVSDQDDRRTTALMMPAIEYLDSLGIWQTIRPDTAALASMRIVDGTRRLIRSPAVTFRASEIGTEAFGYNIPNLVLNRALHEAVSAHPRIARNFNNATAYQHNTDSISVTFSDGQIVTTPLVVAADGRNSLARDAAGIKTRRWHYPQTAVVCSFSHKIPHQYTSTEFHTEDGPFTQVPLPGNRSSLVWVANPRHAEKLMTLDSEQLAREIESKMQSMLGAITVDTKQQAWPLSGLVPLNFAAKRTILIGEAAHVFPPIGAQGLNLGTRDVETLISAITKDKDDAGSDRVIRAYDSGRRPDILARTGSVDVLNRTLLSDFLPAQIIRGTGLEILRVVPPLRAFFMREGLRPGGGFKALLPSFSSTNKKTTLPAATPHQDGSQ
ncbi:UbiH/UbiF family hydroxylase [Pseudochrobactrum sp. sp1633]|uniref:UbiH/UbiF family hydroxylase n=1 Tax=Pseudochrobactrum sp. sp1633 TaxID=3036706 RepID=UPI0025A556C0|nr:UbiH/UbiF family hydroxylase [Pseudochrobactrum sp. sp1633]MDM8346692.1 UbiH/UbiF family hydroxylase [Pseudochrobactrum sp. sp1633]HWD13396.1 UbiH/UbiF family hydroxylase [Pseudochrobactrum sp.]